MKTSIKIAFLTTLMMGSGLQAMEERQQSAVPPKRGQVRHLGFIVAESIEISKLNSKLMTAVICGDNKQIKQLLKEGANINARNENKTALMYAAGTKNIKACELLINMGADVNAKDNNGNTALIYAALPSELEICRLLIAQDADVRAQGYVQAPRLEIGKFLITAMIKLTPQERSVISTLLSLKKRNVPGLDKDTKNLIARTRLDDIKREKKQNVREQIMKIENEKLKAELLKHLDSIK